MDMNLPIQSLTPERIREQLRQAIELWSPALRRTVVADFLSSVDWSNANTEPPAEEVRKMLAALSRLSSAVEEGEIDDREFLTGLAEFAGTTSIEIGVGGGGIIGQANGQTETAAFDTRTSRTQSVLITAEA